MMDLKAVVLLLMAFAVVVESAATSPIVSATSPSVAAATSPTVAAGISSNVPATSPSVAAATSPTVTAATSPIVSATSPSVAAATSPTVTAATSPIVSATSPSVAAATSPTVAAATSPTVAAATSPTVTAAISPTVTPATSPTVAAATSPNVPATSPTVAAATSPTVTPATSPTVAAATSPTVAAGTFPTGAAATSKAGPSVNSRGEGSPTTSSQAVSNSKPNLETAMFKIELILEVNATFQDALHNKSSPLYKQYAKEFIETMSPVYRNIPGFVYIEVTGFTKGSIKVKHHVNVYVDADANGVVSAFNQTVESAVNSLKIFNQSAEFEDSGLQVITKIRDTIKDKCKAKDICLKGFNCTNGSSSKTTCTSPCTTGYCQHGECYVDMDGHPMCRCEITEHVVYGGTNCEKEVERLDMKKGTIAGIAGGVGGGVILLLSIALGCMCYSRRKGKNPDKYMKHQEEDDIHLAERYERDVFSNSRAGGFNYGADIKEEYRYSGRNDGGQRYEEWLEQKYKSEQESNRRRSRADDFRASSYAANRSRNHGDDRREDFDQMDPNPMFGRDISGRQSGLGTSHYRFPEDMSPDYDREDKRQMRPNSRDQDNERPYTRMPTGQTSRPQSNLLSSDYSQGRSVYECIDTDEAYSIKRPDFR